jgi:PAS domain S-box-containing protein
MLDIPEENIAAKGGTRILHTKKIPLIDENGEPKYLLGISEDITELKKSQQALEEREAFFKDIAFSMADFIWETDEKGVYTYFSQKVSSILGYKVEELIGKTRFDLMLPQEAEKKWKMFLKITKNKEVIKGFENWIISKEGNKVCLLTNGVPVLDKSGKLKGYRGVDKDITENKKDEAEKKKLQEHLFLTEKIVAVGQLAGGIAHEINNPLMVIRGYTQSIIRNIKEENPLYTPLKSIEEEVLRCTNMIRDLLTFARKESSVVESVDINILIDETLHLVYSQTKSKNINVVKKSQADLPKIPLNRGMLQRVIVNLFNNAIDATPAGGSITISTKKLQNSIQIDIADTGSGMSEKTKSHIFEPFFTTKDVGEGTGLGLSLCYEIIKNHKGTISFESEQGKGTVFHIVLPIR